MCAKGCQSSLVCLCSQKANGLSPVNSSFFSRLSIVDYVLFLSLSLFHPPFAIILLREDRHIHFCIIFRFIFTHAILTSMSIIRAFATLGLIHVYSICNMIGGGVPISY
ncbi:hypothetical protein BX666DRAFT_1130426 [Dichotomocladium elegans]|nr:hypothetical protein BX666DRAFT_1130426 [Dichotomocladium elegans]